MAAGGSRRPRWKWPVLLKAKPGTGMVSHLSYCPGSCCHRPNPDPGQGTQTPPTSQWKQHQRTGNRFILPHTVRRGILKFELVSEARWLGDRRAEQRRQDGLRLEPTGEVAPAAPLRGGWLRAEHCTALSLFSAKPARQRKKCLMRIACFY